MPHPDVRERETTPTFTSTSTSTNDDVTTRTSSHLAYIDLERVPSWLRDARLDTGYHNRYICNLDPHPRDFYISYGSAILSLSVCIVHVSGLLFWPGGDKSLCWTQAPLRFGW